MYTEKGIHRGSEIKFNVGGVGYEGTHYTSPVRIELDFGAFRDYELQSTSVRRWRLLQTLYSHYKNHRFKITELHFAMDLPYRYDSIKVSPKKYVKLLALYPATKYFDARKKRSKKSKDNFIIYDKCLKAHLAVALTRIELRLEDEELKKLMNNKCIITDSTLQEELKRKIDHKFSDMIVKIGSHEIGLRWQCDRLNAIVAAMEYIQGDDSLLEHLMFHHTDKITHSSKIFAKFLSECKKQGIRHLKLRLPLKLKSYLSLLSHEDRQMLEETISNYYRYDRKWYQSEKFLGVTVPRKRKYKRIDNLNDREKDKILTLYQQGTSMKEISKEVKVDTSTISRLFRDKKIRRIKVKESRFAFGAVFVPLD